MTREKAVELAKAASRRATVRIPFTAGSTASPRRAKSQSPERAYRARRPGNGLHGCRRRWLQDRSDLRAATPALNLGLSWTRPKNGEGGKCFPFEGAQLCDRLVAQFLGGKSALPW